MRRQIIIGFIIIVLLGIGIVIGLLLWDDESKQDSTTDQTNSNITSATEEAIINLTDLTTTSESVIFENGSATITKGGSYYVTGTTTGQIIVDAKEEEIVLFLNNISIRSQNGPAILAKEAKTLTLYLVDGSDNQVSDYKTSEYDAAIYSKCDLELDGTGKLTVVGNIEEGIATDGKKITINGGIYDITSKDDGINTGGVGDRITINDGVLYINAKGDGIDSNRDLIINGGTLFVSATGANDNSGLDADGSYTINGGTIVALGMGMLENPNATSQQITITISLPETISANTLMSLWNDQEQEIISWQSEAPYKTIIVSTPDITNTIYQLYKNGSHSGSLAYGLYVDGTYTKGELVKSN